MSDRNSNTDSSTPWNQEIEYAGYISSMTEPSYAYSVPDGASPHYANYNTTLQMYQPLQSTSPSGTISYGNTMTSSTSCPSFTSLYFEPEGTSSTNMLNARIQDEWTAAMNYDMNTSVQNPPSSYSHIQYQITPTQSELPGHWEGYAACDSRQPTRMRQQNEEFRGRETMNRSKMRASASFTCLSSMEKENRRPYGKNSLFYDFD